eukprot:m.126986 g.126986  ORF g.126986 m.126986 type:complete len:287 (-) comp29236_c0_seq1:119-979(-)
MQRRLARERREFIFRKAKEQQQRVQHDKKQKLKSALESGKPMPTEIRKEALTLKRSMDFDDPDTEQLADSRDDEYRLAGVTDPKVVVTTSRDPSSRLKMFAKEFKLLFPESQRLNRGTYVLPELVRVCNSNQVTDLIVVHEHRGEPDGVVVCHLPFGPTASFSLSSVVMRHDIPGAGTMSEAYPHLIFNNFQTKLGERVTNILKYLFPVPKDDSKRVMTFSNDDDYISFRHHTYTKTGTDIALEEVGPRFEMKLYAIKLGTIDQVDAEAEWVARPYMNTAKKKRFL